MTPSRSRTLWLRTEPLHAVIYFEEHCRGFGRAVGLKGFWMGYFAARTAPMGRVGPGVAAAALGVFAPGMVERALPSAWEYVSPDRVVEERARLTARALRHLVPDVEKLAAAVNGPLKDAVEDAPPLARPLFAANRALADRSDPVEQLWQLATCVREFRGDAHVAVLADHGLDAREALALAAVTGRVDGAQIRQARGWTEEEWADSMDRLRDRGLVDGAGRVTERGVTERERVEDDTDRLAEHLLRPLAKPATEALLAALLPASRSILDSGILPFPNPIGLPRAAG
ncbi:SCO6745 family protein [Streptomyces flavofungini]|uniref:SCO6745 family protein n=1 Tax=Streptomyces flavofungini TaxID=68200 RepID=UPI0034E03E35